jgi:hypothetical protein
LAALFSGVQIAHMSDNLDGLDRWENAFERRSIGRTKILKAALLFFSGKPGVQSCIVRDVKNSGAGIIAQNLKIMPLDFALSFDGFRTLRKLPSCLAPRRLSRRVFRELTVIEGNLDRLG